MLFLVFCELLFIFGYIVFFYAHAFKWNSFLYPVFDFIPSYLTKLSPPAAQLQLFLPYHPSYLSIILHPSISPPPLTPPSSRLSTSVGSKLLCPPGYIAPLTCTNYIISRPVLDKLIDSDFASQPRGLSFPSSHTCAARFDTRMHRLIHSQQDFQMQYDEGIKWQVA